MSSPESVVRLEDLHKTYFMEGIEVRALRGASFVVNKGEFVAIMGPSGCGKSTMMNLLGCLDRPTSGRLWLDQTAVDELTDAQLAQIRNKKIGFVFQQYNLLPRVTALRNVELPLVYSQISRKDRRERARDMLARMGLADREDHMPNQLSGGQQQRVAIARALVNNPSLILADEPTGNLDSKAGKEIMTVIHQLHENGATIVMVTHDPSVGAQSERIIRMLDGVVIADERN